MVERKLLWIRSYFQRLPISILIRGRTEPEPVEQWERHHVLFMDDHEWPKKLFSAVLNLV